MKKETSATLIGVLAPMFWALHPLILTELEAIPTFQILTLYLLFGFLTTIAIILIRRKRIAWTKLDAAAAILGISSNQIFFAYAVLNAPADQAVMIYYLWPVMVLLLAAFLPGESFCIYSAIGVVLAFSGVVLEVVSERIPSGEVVDTYMGYAAAFFAAIGWSAYTLYSRYRKGASSYLLGLGSGVACCISLAIHLLTETTVPVSDFQWLLLGLAGVLVIGVSLFIWDYAIKFGNFRLLGKYAYLTPMLSVILLVLFGRVAFNSILVVSMALVLGGCYLSLVGSKKRREVEES